jgi:hypothetical protein
MEKTKRFLLSGVSIASLSFSPQTLKKIYRPQNQMSRTKMIILDLLPQKRRLIEIRESFVSVVCETNFHRKNTIEYNVAVNTNE